MTSRRRPSWTYRIGEKRPTRLPEGWQPQGLQPGTIAYKIAAGWTADRLQRECEKFVAFWTNKRGAKAEKYDWQAAWAMWVLKADEIDRRGTHGWAS